MTNRETFEWVPTIRVGPVQFGDELRKHLGNLPIHLCVNPYGVEGLTCYGYGEDEEPAYYIDENGRVDDIVCIDGLIYKGTDLIGLPIERVIEILGEEPVEYGEPTEMHDEDFQVAAEFDALGLQLWLRDGIAVSAVVSVANVDDDEEAASETASG